MTVARSELVTRALEVLQRAYAPYSRFHVGAALRAGGAVFEGVNVENASYPLAVCAERTAIGAMVVAGHRELEEIAVATTASPPSAPCGACRQVLLEFAPDPRRVMVTAVNPAGEHRTWTLAELIPDGFSGHELPGRTPP